MDGLRGARQGNFENLQSVDAEVDLTQMILDLHDSIHTLYETHANTTFVPIRPTAPLAANRGIETVGFARNAAPQP